LRKELDETPPDATPSILLFQEENFFFSSFNLNESDNNSTKYLALFLTLLKKI
jgi:hypothetical protein